VARTNRDMAILLLLLLLWMLRTMKVMMMMMMILMVFAVMDVIISTKMIHAFHIQQQQRMVDRIRINHVSRTPTRRTGNSMKLYHSNSNNDNIEGKNNVWSRPELFGTSLIEQTLEEMSNNSNNSDGTILIQGGNEAVKGSALTSSNNSKEERKRQRRSLQQAKVPNFEQYVQSKAASLSDSSSSSLSIFHRKELPSILQLNIGLYCNQACQHCHGRVLLYLLYVDSFVDSNRSFLTLSSLLINLSPLLQFYLLQSTKLN
jgi:hypothetical protein